MARIPFNNDRQWYASRIDQQKRVQDPAAGGTDRDLYEKVKALQDSAASGAGVGPTLTIQEIQEMVGILGNKPESDIGRILSRFLLAPPTDIIVTQVKNADGTSSYVNLRDYLKNFDRMSFFDYGPQTYNFDPDRGGYDAAKDVTEAVTRDEWRDLTVADVSSVGRWPAPITEVPTSTDDPTRPRTVAAGYDGRRKVLTVVFRDGTIYNYYGVANNEWLRFLSTKSKGKVIKNYLDGKVRGPAETSGMPAGARKTLYKVARTGQEMTRGNTYGKGRTPFGGKK